MKGYQFFLGALLIFTVGSKAEEANICTDKECVEIANEFLANMDTTLDPCDDFYDFTCAKFVERYPIPDDKTAVSRMSQVADMVNEQLKKVLEEPIKDDEPKHFVNLKKYYKGCMNTDNIEKIGLNHINSLTEKLGGWPMIKDKDPSATWETVIYKLRENGLKGDHLLKIDRDVDMKDTSSYLVLVEEGNLGLDQSLLVEGKDSSSVQVYTEVLVSLAEVFGVDEEKAREDLSDVMDFGISLAKAMEKPESKANDLEARYNIYTVDTLKGNFTGFPWDNYIKHFMPENVKLPSTKKVMVSNPEYVSKLIKLLETTDQKVIRNYLIFEAVWSMASYLPKDVTVIQHRYKAMVSGQKKASARYEDCLETVVENYLPVASAMYIQRYSNDRTKQLAQEMLNDLQKEFIEILREGGWPEEDKKAGIEKVQNYYAHVAYPNEMKDNKVMASFYGRVEVDEDDYFKSTINIRKNSDEIRWGQFLHPVNRTSWISFENPAVVNAQYSTDMNLVLLPAAVLQGIFFNEKRPRYLNYAAMGSGIGHEMSHGFDDEGHLYDKNGNLNNWQSEAGAASYKKKEQCMINQYNKFSIHGQNLDGASSVGENIADFGGWMAAYRSYKDWEKKNGPEPGLPGLNYTNHQLFWIASSNLWCNNERPETTIASMNSDPHAPNRFRVNGALSNLKIFSDDFGCPVGSKMNPVDKCTPW